MKKVNQKVEEEILNFYLKDKLSTTKISVLVGVSSTCVSNIIKRNGYNPRNISESKKGIKRGSKLPIDNIIFLYNQGSPSTKIAEIIGCSKRSILNILNDNNIPLREPGWDKNYKNPLEEKICISYLNGNPINKIKKDFELSYGLINKILNKRNIIRTEDKHKGSLGKTQSEDTKNKVRQTRKSNKEEGLYDHIYIKKTGLTYKEFQAQLPEFKKYFQKVRTITNQQPLETLTNFEKRGKAGQHGAYHLDHKYSIIEGFKQNIDPKVIGNIKNLEMITWENNMTKQGNCSISIQELKKLIA